MSKRNSNSFWVIVVVILLFLLYLASLGTISSDQIKKTPNAFKDDQEKAKRKHKRLVDLIEKQKALKTKLAKKFKRIYLGVRIGLVLIWGGVMTLLILLKLINNLGDFLNYSELSVLLILTFNFITFGSLKNFKDYIVLLKTKTENWVYGKYVDINLRIETNEIEKIEIEETLNESK
ncbi:MAG: hypothetical protein COA33_008895 [Fluviicola sp.]|nr:hypothetical protein [Fluviicola sp.]